MKSFIFLAFILSLSLFAHARPDRKYGSAGCGLGNMAFEKKDNQIIAATTNGTSGSQTFGISSGTSNCTDDEPNVRKGKAKIFIQDNRERLANDAARGSGETLAALAAILGIESEREFGLRLQAHYSEIFTKEASTVDVTEKIVGLF